MWSQLSVLLLIFTFGNVSSLYFHMKESQTKCFLEEVPAETLVAVTLRVEEPAKDEHSWHLSNKGVNLDIADPTGNSIHSQLYSAQGTFSFTPHTPGEYKMCLSSNSSAWFGGQLMRVHLDIAIGDHAQNYNDIAAKEKLTELQLRVRQLIDQVEMIVKDQHYLRAREESFRTLSSDTLKQVTRWSIFQLLVLILVGVWQMRNLRSFFQAKKLV